MQTSNNNLILWFVASKIRKDWYSNGQWQTFNAYKNFNVTFHWFYRNRYVDVVWLNCDKISSRCFCYHLCSTIILQYFFFFQEHLWSEWWITYRFDVMILFFFSKFSSQVAEYSSKSPRRELTHGRSSLCSIFAK